MKAHVHKQGFVAGGHFLLTLGAGNFDFDVGHLVGSAPILCDQLGDELVVEDGDDVFGVGFEQIQLDLAVHFGGGTATFTGVFHRQVLGPRA